MTPSEREAALAELEASRRAYADALTALGEARWRFRPAPDRWSIADCAEHLVAAEVPLPKLLAGARRGSAAADDASERDAFVRFVTRDRSRRVQSPERIRPTGRFATRDETLAAFAQRRAANIVFVRSTQEPLREFFFPHPFAGEIDLYQWIRTLPAHVERHLEQIAEIRLDPGFPKD